MNLVNPVKKAGITLITLKFLHYIKQVRKSFIINSWPKSSNVEEENSY